MAMGHAQSGTGFKAAMTAAFIAGIPAYLFGLMYSSGILFKAGFGVLMLFSLLFAAGINAADLSRLGNIRISTKLAAFMLPFSANGGALAIELLYFGNNERMAFYALIIACVIWIISGEVLVRRYMEDDF